MRLLAANGDLMAVTNLLKIGNSPTLWDVELVNSKALSLSAREPIILQLSRNTKSNFFADTAVARLVASLAGRGMRLVVRDHHHSWVDPNPQARFLQAVDGVATIVYCTPLPIAPKHALAFRDANRLENSRQEIAPTSLSQQLCEGVLRTAKLNDSGSARTYIAIDPKFSIPRELSLHFDKLALFEGEIREIFRDFGIPEMHQGQIRESLYTAVYEIFTNTFEHAQNRVGEITLPGLRYIRFAHHIAHTGPALAERAEGFHELSAYLTRRFKSGVRRFLEITIGDGGPGILNHYLRSTKSARPDDDQDTTSLLNRILTQDLSSKQLIGAGYGLPTALDALRRLRGFVSLRTDDQWLCRDFSSAENRRLTRPTSLMPVRAVHPLSRTEGTQFSIMMDLIP